MSAPIRPDQWIEVVGIMGAVAAALAACAAIIANAIYKRDGGE